MKNGYRRPFFERYAAWLGVWPKSPNIDPKTGAASPRFQYCDEASTPVLSGVLEGDFGCSTKFKVKVAAKLGPSLRATGLLMFWVLAIMVPVALVVGVVSGMREGSQARSRAVDSLDRDDLHSRIRIRRRADDHFRHVARMAQRLGGVGDRDGDHLLQLHPAGRHAGDLRHGLCRADDARVDGRSDERAVYPHRAAQGAGLLRGCR